VNTGYYKCKACKTLIHVLTCSYHARYSIPYKLGCCPHCKSPKLESIEGKDFREFDGIWMKVKRKYNSKVIRFSLKFQSKE